MSLSEKTQSLLLGVDSGRHVKDVGSFPERVKLS